MIDQFSHVGHRGHVGWLLYEMFMKEINLLQAFHDKFKLTTKSVNFTFREGSSKSLHTVKLTRPLEW